MNKAMNIYIYIYVAKNKGSRQIARELLSKGDREGLLFYVFMRFYLTYVFF